MEGEEQTRIISNSQQGEYNQDHKQCSCSNCLIKCITRNLVHLESISLVPFTLLQ